MKFRTTFALTAAMALSTTAIAQTTDRDHPELVVAIAVDQLSSDVFAQYREHYTGGLAKLLEGAVFLSGYQAHAATETCPGHSTILTGAHPARNGIIANRWFDMDVEREDTRIYCAEDVNVEGSSSSDYTPSAAHLLVPTLGDLMKRANPDARVVSVGGKDRSALMMGGQSADHVFWPSSAAAFETFGEVTNEPAALARTNAAAEQMFNTAQPAHAIPDFCRPLNRAVPIGDGQTVGDHLFGRAAGDRRGQLISPEADDLVLSLASALVEDLDLGGNHSTDLLAIALAATDFIGHTYGTEGVEMCIQMAEMDRQLGAFFELLESRDIDYVVTLTADHGGLDLPERQNAQGIADAERLDAAVFASLNEMLSEELGLSGELVRSDGPFGDYYIDRSVAASSHTQILDRAMALLREHPQVHGVYAHDEIAAHPISTAPPEQWTVMDRLRASFHPDRSGDFVVLLRPRVTPVPDPTAGYVATHGSPWNYDREVPILFWWPGAEHFEQPLGVMTVDIMPTLASLIGLDISGVEIDGRCLDVMASLDATNCP